MRVHFDALRRPARVAKTLRTELESLGVKVGLGRAQDLVAEGFGYASYRELQSVVGQRPADPWDEDASPEVVAARRSRQVAAYASAGIDRGQAEALVARIGPSARRACGRGEAEAKPMNSVTGPVLWHGSMPDPEHMMRNARMEDLKAMAFAFAEDSDPTGSRAVLLNNGWLLVDFEIDDVATTAAAATWRLRNPSGPAPSRVLAEDPALVASFRARIGDTEATWFDGLGNPAARRTLRDLVAKSFAKRADEISIVHDSLEPSVRHRIDGSMHHAGSLSREEASALCLEAYHVAETSGFPYAVDKPQAARLTAASGLLPARVHEAKLQWVPLPRGGRQLDIRLFPIPVVPRIHYGDQPMAGYEGPLAQAIQRMRRRPSGLNIIAGPYLSGKSSSLASILSAEPGERRVVAIDDGSGQAIAGATQIVPQRHASMHEEREARREAIAAAMRSNPDVLVLGEIQDIATADMAFRASMSGIQVWATMRATDAVTVISCLRDLGIEEHRVYDPKLVTGLIGQRLVRRTCPACSVGYDEAMEAGFLTGDLRRTIKPLSMGRTPHRMRFASPGGCEECTSGYMGQRLVAEAVLPSQELMKRLSRNERVDVVEQWYGCRPILEEAFRVALTGEVDIREIEARVGFVDDLTSTQIKAIHAASPDLLKGDPEADGTEGDAMAA